MKVVRLGLIVHILVSIGFLVFSLFGKATLLDKLNTAINKDLEANEEKTLKLTNEQLYALRSSVECNKANININITK